MLMAAGRLNVPSVFLYGGSILPGHYKDQALDVVSVFEAVGACAAGTITENELGEIERRACPTEGSCAGMFTANTMASVGEAIGMCVARQLGATRGRPAPRRLRVRVGTRGDEPPRARHPPAPDHDQGGVRERDRGRRWRSAARPTRCCTCSRSRTRREVELELDDFNRIGARVPHIADMKPHGKYHMADLDRIGGVQVVHARAARRRACSTATA